MHGPVVGSVVVWNKQNNKSDDAEAKKKAQEAMVLSNAAKVLKDVIKAMFVDTMPHVSAGIDIVVVPDDVPAPM